MQRSGFTQLLILLVVLLLSFFQVGGVAAHENHKVIKFGVYPYKTPRTIVKLYSPITKRLAKALGVEVQLVTAPDFATYVARGKAGKYDLALPCVHCYYKIRGPGGYSVIAKGVPSFYGGTVVRKDSGIESVSQLKGKKIASVGKHSYAAHLFLLPQLYKNGIHPQKEVEFQFLGKLDSVIFGVLNRKYAAGTIRLDALAHPAFDGVRNDLKFISQSEPIPQFPYVVKKDMPPAQIAIIREVLMSLNSADESDRKILQSLRLQAVRSATDADYDSFEKILKQSMEYLKR